MKINRKMLFLSLICASLKAVGLPADSLGCELLAQEVLIELKAVKEEVENLRAIPSKVLRLAEKRSVHESFRECQKDVEKEARNRSLKYFSDVKKGVGHVCKVIDANQKLLSKAIDGTSRLIGEIVSGSRVLDMTKVHSRLQTLCRNAKSLKVAHNRPARQLLDLEFKVVNFDPSRIVKMVESERVAPEKIALQLKPSIRVLNFAQKERLDKAVKLAKASVNRSPAPAPVKRLASLKRVDIVGLDKKLEKNSVEQNVALLSELEKEISLLGRSIDRLSSQIGYDLDSLEAFGRRLMKV